MPLNISGDFVQFFLQFCKERCILYHTAEFDLVGDDGVDPLHVSFGNLGAFCRSELFACCQITAFFRNPTVVRPQADGFFGTQNVSAHSHAGVIGDAEQIGQGRQDIHTADRSIDLQIHIFQTAAPDNQGVFVSLEQIIFINAVEFCQTIFLQTPGGTQAIGIMIRRHDNHGIIRNAGIFQLLHQRSQSLFQFQITGDVSFDTVGVGQMLYQIPVLLGLGIAQLIVTAVAADGHVVYAEGLLIDVLRNGEIKHLMVALGPYVLNAGFQTIVHADKLLITQIHMGLMAVIESIDVVVISSGEVTFLLQKTADGVERLLLGIGVHLAVHGKTGQIYQLTATGAAAPEGFIVVGKFNALGSQSVQGRGQFRIDDRIMECFGGNKNQVFSLE